jgi:hypothetical protein
METTEKKGLCETCRHRDESIECVRKWRERGGKGIVCDPAPRVQCKDHEGYGREGTREYCQDYWPRQALPSAESYDPEKTLKAHQYLYYVLGTPVLTDQDYDTWCRENGLEGKGGSDLASSYSEEIIGLACLILRGDVPPLTQTTHPVGSEEGAAGTV